jgi:glycosyltransferase involved in cell wall biosynthesis
MNYKQGRRKLALELIAMAPFVWLGKLYGWLFPLKTPTTHFLFFSSADIGGGPKVNADITACLKDKKPLIIFSKKPKNNGFLPLFRGLGFPILDLHQRIDNKGYHFVNFFYRGVLASWINNAPQPVVFGGECIFFYKIIPHLRKNIPRIELCHLATWLPYSIGLVDHITIRICSTQRLKDNILQQYEESGVPARLFERLHFIENKIDIPPYHELHNPRLEIVFIGRGAPQKRIHLIAAIAARLHQMGLPAHISFVGDVDKVINPSEYPFCKFYGNVNDDELMHRIYRESDVLILTSAYEGLPLVVMQMMAYGRVVVSTAVNGIPDYISHMENGLLIRSTEEEAIIDEGVTLLKLLMEQPGVRSELGRRSMEIATQKFGGELFCREYRKVLLETKPSIAQ